MWLTPIIIDTNQAYDVIESLREQMRMLELTNKLQQSKNEDLEEENKKLKGNVDAITTVNNQLRNAMANELSNVAEYMNLTVELKKKLADKETERRRLQSELDKYKNWSRVLAVAAEPLEKWQCVKAIPTIGELLDHYAKHPLDMDSTDDSLSKAFEIYKAWKSTAPDVITACSDSELEAIYAIKREIESKKTTTYLLTIYKHKTDKYPDRFSVTANSLSEATKKINDHLKALFNLTLDNCYMWNYTHEVE